MGTVVALGIERLTPDPKCRLPEQGQKEAPSALWPGVHPGSNAFRHGFLKRRALRAQRELQAMPCKQGARAVKMQSVLSILILYFLLSHWLV